MKLSAKEYEKISDWLRKNEGEYEYKDLNKKQRHVYDRAKEKFGGGGDGNMAKFIKLIKNGTFTPK